jgi:hypothetical protein
MKTESIDDSMGMKEDRWRSPKQLEAGVESGLIMRFPSSASVQGLFYIF